MGVLLSPNIPESSSDEAVVCALCLRIVFFISFGIDDVLQREGML